jgi:hypothetical protein
VNYEAGGPAQVAGAMIRTVEGENGIFTDAALSIFANALR